MSINIVAGARTAVGTFLGTLSNEAPIDLGTHAAKATVERAGIDPAAIDGAVFGTVIPTETRDPYLSRVVAVNAGMPVSGHAMNVNRLCGSGLQAIVSASQLIKTEDAAVMLAGGAESMSKAPYFLPDLRSGKRMGGAEAVDMLSGALTDPFGHGGMGITAENIAERNGISRERQDEFALESQKRAAAAIERGAFKEQIAPYTVKTRKGEVLFDTDEHPRASTLETLGSLRPTFKKDGTVTAGNASGMNDAAATLLLANDEAVAQHKLSTIGRVVSWGIAGCSPEVMGLGPINAVPIALKRAGLSVADLDVIESNEAFAVQALAVSDALDFDPAKVNPNGGAIALGHPIGATGAILALKALYHLRDTGGRYGLITMCIGGGQGIAVVVEAN